MATCNPDGRGYGACEGEVAPEVEVCGDGEDNDCNGEADEAAAGCTCQPGTSEACYSGPPGTEGLGNCAPGVRICEASGTAYGPCQGEVLPEAERCGVPAEDESCDGEPNCTGAHRWSRRFGESGGAMAYNITVDPVGSVLFSGWFNGTIDFGGGPLASTGGDDIFVVKLDPEGSRLWSKQFGGPGVRQYVHGLAADAEGNVLVSGLFEETIDFGGGLLTSAGGDDVFVAKLDAEGNHLWSKRFGGAGDDYATRLALDENGDIIFTGGFQQAIDFGGGPIPSVSTYDIFVAKLDGDGVHLWSHSFGGPDEQAGEDVAFTPDGGVVVTGFLRGSATFGNTVLSSAGGDDIFFLRLNSQGNPLWSRRYGSQGQDVGITLTVDGAGDVLLTGVIGGTVDFGGGPLASAGGLDVFLAKFGSGGNPLWTKRFGDSGYYQVGVCTAADVAGNAVLAGHYQSTVDFGGGPLPPTSGRYPFLAKFDPGGDHAWSRGLGIAGSYQEVPACAVDSVGQIFVAGYFNGTVSLGGATLTAQSGMDVFVAKLAP
jgi:hypothetical protein